MSENFDGSRQKLTLSQFPEPGATIPMPSDSGWWFTVSAYVVGIIAVVIAPDTRKERAFAAVVLMASSFALVWAVRWLIRRCHSLRTRWIKGRKYDRVYEIAASHGRELESSQALIRRILSGWPSHTGISVSVFAGSVLLEVTRKGKRALPATGGVLSLLDLESGSVLGTFEVTQSDGKLCQAKDRGDLDAVFRGYALKTNAKFLPENMALYVLPEEDGPNE